MDPAPLCKTAILSFIVDEALTRLRNVSSISRKRAQMIIVDKDIRVREYNKKALKINGWVKVGKQGRRIEGIESIKKGLSNYDVNIQEEADRIIALNGKLRCHDLYFKSEVPNKIDYATSIRMSKRKYDNYLKCSFNKALNLNLTNISSSQINQVITKFKQIENLLIYCCSLSSIDLSSKKINKIQFSYVTFLEKVDLPSNLDYLRVLECTNTHFLNFKRVKEIDFYKNDSFDLIKKCKGVEIAYTTTPLSELINYLPSTIRELAYESDEKNIDLENLKKKFPFLIRIINKTPIEMVQTLNLRIINPIITETQEIFTLRPRKIISYDANLEQLNKHPELFEKVEQISIDSNKFNFDCLPVGIKLIEFDNFSIEGEKLESLEKNNWKFEKSTVSILFCSQDQTLKILNSLKKVRKIKIDQKIKYLVKDYPQFKFTIN